MKTVNSINELQSEENRRDLVGDPAIRTIKRIVERAENCFFCTTCADGSCTARPMNVRQVDDEGNLWFLSADDSYKNDELTKDNAVRLYFQGSKNSDFLYVDGKADLSKDRRKIEELWEPVLRTWFTDGVEDSRISVIRFRPSSGYYWETKHGSMVAGIKMMIGAAIGKTLDDSMEGTLEV
jgi:general stress protein 26